MKINWRWYGFELAVAIHFVPRNHSGNKMAKRDFSLAWFYVFIHSLSGKHRLTSSGRRGLTDEVSHEIPLSFFSSYVSPINLSPAERQRFLIDYECVQCEYQTMGSR